jgi:hypothetical protein
MQRIEETLFANRKTKEKKCSKQLTKYPLRTEGDFCHQGRGTEIAQKI